jgi:RNA polymerase sigma-70 factor, ECF subfamily
MSEETDTPGQAWDEDFKLIRRFQAEDNAAFDQLVLKYKDLVMNVCFRFMRNNAEADDCAQETFVKVFRSLHKFRFESSFSTWLYRIAVNTCKTRLCSQEYRRSKYAVSIDKQIETEEGSVQFEIADKALSPRASMENKDRAVIIQEAINSLPEEQKTVVILRDIEGLSYEEISKISGYNLGTVKSKLARARQELKNKLKGMI